MQRLTYTRVNSPEAAIAAFKQAGQTARFIAGGTTLYDLMKLGIEQPTHLIDVSGIAALSRIDTGSEALRFGSMALMSDVAYTPIVRNDYPVLSESLLKAASQQLRNMATVGGNLLQRTRCPYFRAGNGVYPCNKRQPGSGCAAINGLDRSQAVLGASDTCTAVAPGDWPVALVALDAQIEILGPEGLRMLSVEELHRLPETSPEQEFELMSGEIITAIIIPKSSIGRASTYHKVRDRESYAFALASAAVALDLDGTIVQDARIALGGVATKPWRVRQSEASLIGTELTPEKALEAGHTAFATAKPGKHNAFKIELGARVVAKALMIAAERKRA